MIINSFEVNFIIMYTLLLLSSLLHITTCTVYTVTPDDHYYPNTTCHHCHNLQHYLLNVTKYFTSNTQLLFLPGLHHLHTDLIIQNVHNISLIGSTADGTTQRTVIQSNLSSLSMFNISKLIIRGITINSSYSDGDILYYLPDWVPLTIKECSFVLLHHIQVYQVVRVQLDLYKYGIVAVNVMGNSYFDSVECHGELQLIYNGTNIQGNHHSLLVNNCTIERVTLDMPQKHYKVMLKIANIRMQNKMYNHKSFIHAKEVGTSEVLIINCQFVSNSYRGGMFIFSSTGNGSMQFINCQFINNYSVIKVLRSATISVLMELQNSINVEIINCNFHINNGDRLLQAYGSKVRPVNVLIRDTNFTTITVSRVTSDQGKFILLSSASLIFKDSVSFYNITTFKSIIFLGENSSIIISGNVKFLHNHVRILIDMHNNSIQYMIIKQDSVLNITQNDIWSHVHTNLPKAIYPYPFCFYQYFASSPSAQATESSKFLIMFNSNQCNHTSCYSNIPLTNCRWLATSLFNNIIPLEVNNKYIHLVNSNSETHNLSQIIEQSSLCVCTNELDYDCHINDLGYLYPGQTLIVSLYHLTFDRVNAVAVKTDINQNYATSCIVLDVNENLQRIDKQCTKVHYTVGFSTEKWCQLFLKLALDSDDKLNVFSIKQMTCPTGFIKINRRCQCDPVLVRYGITNCNINDQTILRPANSWISATTHNNSYTYHISLHCPFHYCLPHSSHLNLSTPNSQCQFNRSSLLCGHCQHGLSTVFGSSYCKHCSSLYLLLIIPIAIAGLVLVLLLFVLNLTVTNGTINGFILYANIISINTPVFFTELNHFTPTYTFISLANLDLGIQTCFYNGMDDYAKMWLQLAFPFYLIFIATLIIITSRYSTTIQRLTARRALPVLATLFLLSYTKILRIVSSVLFFYSIITHLPSKHTTLVWSVDANVPLFGVRFTILFIVCLILFLILVPFNVILLFTRTLSRFRFINKFKPLLDAYQGPYEDKSYYWTGLQLMIRVVFYGMSSLDRNINISVSTVLLSMIIGLHGTMSPFKVKLKNYQELLLFFNLQGLFAVSSYIRGTANITAINILITVAILHFGCIILYHMVTYMCDGVITNKIFLYINSFTRWIIGLDNKSKQQFKIQDGIRDNIPEVAFNFHEYRDPLLAVD